MSGQAVHRHGRRRVLARRDRFRLGVHREVQEVGLDAARRRVAAGVGVDREEQIGSLAIGDRGALFERDEHVAAARHHHLDARLLFEQLLDAQRDVERQLGFDDPVALRARIVAAVAGVDDDARHAQPELARQRELAVRVRHRRHGRQRFRRRRSRGERRLGRGRASLRVPMAWSAAASTAWRRPSFRSIDRRRHRDSRRCRWRCRHGHRGDGAAEIDDQPVRPVERVDAVVRHAVEIDDEASRVLRVASEPDVRDEVAVELERGVLEAGRRLHVLEIEEHAPRVLDLFLVYEISASRSTVIRTPSGSTVRWIWRSRAADPVAGMARSERGSSPGRCSPRRTGRGRFTF